MSNLRPTLPLVLPSAPLDDIKVAFDGDLLQRKRLAERLTGYLDRLQVGAVIALDAPWGEGKTWFSKHWAKHLEEHQHAVGVIDAFSQDYVEDPFLPLSAAILDLTAPDAVASQNLKRGAIHVMRAVMPGAVKVMLHVAARGVGVPEVASTAVKFLGLEEQADATEDAVAGLDDRIADAAGTWVKERLENWASEQKTIEDFRTALTEYAATQYAATKKPVVILIDELDRCRPAFAVRLIERIKHFFDVPHLVFVLLMNRDQLEKAIRGVYGSETDAAAYLGKFLHLSLRLPTGRGLAEDFEDGLTAYVFDTLKRLGANDRDFATSFAHCTSIFELSARDVERGCTLFSLAETDRKGNAALLAYFIAIKLKQPVIFSGLLRGDGKAHEACRALLNDIPHLMRMQAPLGTAEVSISVSLDIFLRALITLHEVWRQRYVPKMILPTERQPGKEDMDAFESLFGRTTDLQKLIHKTLRRLDLTVE